MSSWLYDFRIRSQDFRRMIARINGSDLVGQISLRIGMTDHIMLYAGNLGYKLIPLIAADGLLHAPSSYCFPSPDIMG